MSQSTTNRVMNVLIIVPIVMLLFSTLCLCIAGQMVGYFLTWGAAALIPLGFDTRRAAKFVSLAVVAISMAAAQADHDGGMKFWKRFYENRLAAAERAATSQSVPTTSR